MFSHVVGVSSIQTWRPENLPSEHVCNQKTNSASVGKIGFKTSAITLAHAALHGLPHWRTRSGSARPSLLR